MATKIKKFSKIKIWSLTLGVSALGGIAAIAASCAGPSSATLNDLFKPNNGSGFANVNNGSTTNVLTNGLMQTSGFKALLKSQLGHVLVDWYKNNGDSTVKNKYQNFISDINDSWDNQVKDYQKQYGNDYQVRLQTNILDNVGGSIESWKQNQIEQKVFDDFITQLYTTNYLNYTDGTGNVINSPDANQIRQATNWNKIQYTNGGYKDEGGTGAGADNNSETYAQFQNALFNHWVQQQNPNLVSRVVFTNDTPSQPGGLEYLFKKTSDDLAPSYAFQAFKNNLNDPTSAKGMKAYKEITNKLSSYVQSSVAGGTIDIPNNLSSDAGGKLLMTADDMYNSYDVAFTAAFVQQYNRMIGDTNKDNVGAPTDVPKSSGINDFNVMNLFLRNPDADDPATAYTKPNSAYNNLQSTIDAADVFYSKYKNLSNSTSTLGIYNVALPKVSGVATDISDQFIFARGTDGVHIIGIDGGSYYLNATTKVRDRANQETFLKFRSFLASLPQGLNANNTYTFNANDQVKTWFDKNQELLVYQVLNDALNGLTSETPVNGFTKDKNFFNLAANADFKTAFENLKSQIDNYVTSYANYTYVLGIQSAATTMRDKLNAWGQTYSDDVKNLTPEKIGLAAVLPYVRAVDGDYFGPDQYYLNLAKTNHITWDGAPTKGQSVEIINKTVDSYYGKWKKETTGLLTALEVVNLPTIQYSQNVIVESKKYAPLNLALNLVIQATISSQPVVNSVKAEYFLNNPDFNSLYDFTNDDIKIFESIPESILKDTILTYYKQNAWMGVSNKTSYGNYKNQSDLNGIIGKVWEQKNITTQPYSDDAINYYTFLYTFSYLLKDNLANFKAILSSQIFQGTQAAISWSVPSNPDTTTNPLTAFAVNPNYIQGSADNWFNADGFDTNTYKPDPFNDAANPYEYTKTNDPTNSKEIYGFNGLTTANNHGNLNTNVADAIYSKYGSSGIDGSLSAYGTKDDLINLVKQVRYQTQLDGIVNMLSTRANAKVAPYFQQDDKGNDVLSFDQKREFVLNLINDFDAKYFKTYAGYIGGKKVGLSFADMVTDTIQFKGSEPVTEADKLTTLITYMQQVNYRDVQNLGGTNWTVDTTTNDSMRLGVNLSALLAIVASQAADAGTQAQALISLVNHNQIDNNQTLITINDKRLYDALGVSWALKP